LVAAVALNATAIGMTRTTDWFEIISYALIVAVGAWLVWSKATGRGHHHDHAAKQHAPGLDKVAHAASEHDGEHHHGQHHGHEHDHAHTHAHIHDHSHDHAHESCGHSHAPDPKLLSKPLTVSRAWAAILAVGIRPCSGAIIVLVFALSQHLLLTGIGAVMAMSFGTFITVAALATLAVAAKDVALRMAKFQSKTTERIMRVVEIGGAVLVLLLGVTLLGGALSGGLPGTV
jgi:nickel/cobalt transporter (NicO) family protein